MNKKFLVATPSHTGSTLLANIIIGFFAPNNPIFHFGNMQPSKLRKFWQKHIIFKIYTVFKTHDLKLENFTEYGDMYIISCERKELNILVPDKIHSCEKCLVLEYEELKYNSQYVPDSQTSLDQVVDNVANKISEKFNIEIDLTQRKQAVDRVLKMDQRYEDIKNKPFNYLDKFYHIHGGHRKRAPRQKPDRT